ncbi:Hsp70 family protein [Taklimakanibacter lacteus]|uniref:Hsp70 family protein n=1 Tax=Taklimakanibacter lacteus TaxID=2268456 RepID=UPI000E66B163
MPTALDDISIGIDFGTTNTVVALAGPDGEASALQFDHAGIVHRTYNTALCFWEDHEGGGSRLSVAGGPWAIEQFLQGLAAHRFIQSFKTFAASSLFTQTRIFRQTFRFEDLLATFLRVLSRNAGPSFSLAARTVVIGRPVRFAGASPDDDLAMRRYRSGFGGLGIAKGHYVYEPVGAAFSFARQLRQDATVLVADFGGGTSDFSVLRFEKRDGHFRARPLGHAGIGIAGDAFDYRIIDHVVSPRLGKGASYRSFGKTLTMPNGYYANFARWNQLAVMKTSGELKELRQLARQAVDPAPLLDLIDIVENDLGFALYRAVTATKIALSSAERAPFDFRHGDLVIGETITRGDFETWIAEDVEAIAATVDKALADAGLAASEIDKVFLTGGSSFIPAIWKVFGARFGEARLTTGDQFESIAYGLALIGRSPGLADWTVGGQ